MQEIITIYDYLLLPFYLLIFSLIIRKVAKKYQGTSLKKIFFIAFALHIGGCVLNCLIFQYYYGYSDSFGFYLGGGVIRDMILKDITSFKYLFSSGKDIAAAATFAGLGDAVPVSMPNNSNAMMMKISALVSFFTFNKYMLISLVFALFSFVGLWKLFRLFNSLIYAKYTKVLAFGILYTPTIWFWSGGIIKEALAFGCLGIIISYMHEMFIKKNFSIAKFFLIALLIFILIVVKSYIIIILFVSIAIALCIEKIKQIRNLLVRVSVILLMISVLITTSLVTNISSGFESIVKDAYTQIQTFKSDYQKVGEMEDNKGTIKGLATGEEALRELSVFSILLQAPSVIFTCLFRPFLWESGKIIIFLASLEATITLIFTILVLWKSRVWGFLKYSFSDFYTTSCFIFSVLFALIVGFTTYNFGTMVRYKIILLPFFFFLLISVYDKSNKRRAKSFI